MRAHAAILVLSLGAPLAAGCGDDSEPCATCPQGQLCVDEVCRVPCARHEDCAADERCAAGLCEPGQRPNTIDEPVLVWSYFRAKPGVTGENAVGLRDFRFHLPHFVRAGWGGLLNIETSWYQAPVLEPDRAGPTADFIAAWSEAIAAARAQGMQRFFAISPTHQQRHGWDDDFQWFPWLPVERRLPGILPAFVSGRDLDNAGLFEPRALPADEPPHLGWARIIANHRAIGTVLARVGADGLHVDGEMYENFRLWDLRQVPVSVKALETVQVGIDSGGVLRFGLALAGLVEAGALLPAGTPVRVHFDGYDESVFWEDRNLEWDAVVEIAPAGGNRVVIQHANRALKRWPNIAEEREEAFYREEVWDPDASRFHVRVAAKVACADQLMSPEGRMLLSGCQGAPDGATVELFARTTSGVPMHWSAALANGSLAFACDGDLGQHECAEARPDPEVEGLLHLVGCEVPLRYDQEYANGVTDKPNAIHLVTFEREGGGEYAWFTMATDEPPGTPWLRLFSGLVGSSVVHEVTDCGECGAPPEFYQADHDPRRFRVHDLDRGLVVAADEITHDPGAHTKVVTLAKARVGGGDKVVRFKRFAKHQAAERRERKRYLEWRVTPVDVGDAWSLTLTGDSLSRGYVDPDGGPFDFWNDALDDLAPSCLPNPEGDGAECSVMRVLDAVDCGRILGDEAFALRSDWPTRTRVREVARRFAASFIEGYAAEAGRSPWLLLNQAKLVLPAARLLYGTYPDFLAGVIDAALAAGPNAARVFLAPQAFYTPAQLPLVEGRPKPWDEAWSEVMAGVDAELGARGLPTDAWTYALECAPLQQQTPNYEAAALAEQLAAQRRLSSDFVWMYTTVGMPIHVQVDAAHSQGLLKPSDHLGWGDAWEWMTWQTQTAGTPAAPQALIPVGNLGLALDVVVPPFFAATGDVPLSDAHDGLPLSVHYRDPPTFVHPDDFSPLAHGIEYQWEGIASRADGRLVVRVDDDHLVGAWPEPPPVGFYGGDLGGHITLERAREIVPASLLTQLPADAGLTFDGLGAGPVGTGNALEAIWWTLVGAGSGVSGPRWFYVAYDDGTSAYRWYLRAEESEAGPPHVGKLVLRPETALPGAAPGPLWYASAHPAERFHLYSFVDHAPYAATLRGEGSSSPRASETSSDGFR